MAREKKLFIPVTKCPDTNDPWYTRKKFGGYSPCIDGKPQEWTGSTIRNCVGMAWGETAYHENNKECKIGCAKGLDYPQDAYVWIQNSKAQGYEIGTKAELGAVAVWVSNRNSKLGHVATCEKPYPDGSWDSSESGYDVKTKAWWSIHYNSKSYKAGYSFKGFILPKYEYYIEPEQKFQVGDKVQITAKGNARADGKGSTCSGIGYKRYIISYQKGQPYPYQVGLINPKTRTTGYYKESALKKI